MLCYDFVISHVKKWYNLLFVSSGFWMILIITLNKSKMVWGLFLKLNLEIDLGIDTFNFN